MECFNNTKVSACAIGNELNYTEHSVAIIKSYLSSKTKFIRHETDFKYLKENIDSDGRLLKHDDTYLENLIFKKHTKIKI